MAVQATYQLQIDWDNDGSFATPGDDVSADLRRAELDRGYDTPLSRFPYVGRARFVLNNVNKQYSPPLDSTVVPHRPVRFRMTFNAVTVVQFRGFVEFIQPTAGEYGQRIVVIECVDASALLDIFEGRASVLLQKRANEIIEPIVDDVYTPPGTNYEEGINVFPTTGEQWTFSDSVGLRITSPTNPGASEPINAAQKITDACASDWGRFFIAKDGSPSFFNRHHMPLDSTTELTMSGTFQDMGYAKHVDDIFNWVEVTYLPRKIGNRAEVLGRFSPERAVQIEPLATEEFVIPFRDPVNQAIRVGGYNVITPVAGSDYNATSDEAGEGDDVTGNLSLTFTAYADRATVEIENTHISQDAWIQKFEVRGLPIRSREPETVKAVDVASINEYGRRKLSVTAMLMSSNAEAASLAQYLVDVYKDPRDVVTDIEIPANKSTTFMEAARDLELMDRVVVSEDQTGLSSFAGHIYRIKHVIDDKFNHRVFFDLETPYTLPGDPFLIGSSGLDGPDVLIY